VARWQSTEPRRRWFVTHPGSGGTPARIMGPHPPRRDQEGGAGHQVHRRQQHAGCGVASCRQGSARRDHGEQGGCDEEGAHPPAGTPNGQREQAGADGKREKRGEGDQEGTSRRHGKPRTSTPSSASSTPTPRQRTQPDDPGACGQRSARSGSSARWRHRGSDRVRRRGRTDQAHLGSTEPREAPALDDGLTRRLRTSESATRLSTRCRAVATSSRWRP
jgi:hypothetical protein